MEDAQRGAEYVGNDVCGSCHGTGRDESRQDGRQVPRVNFADYRDSAHGAGRVGCEQCHGPGSRHAVAPAEDNILSTPEAVTSNLCGACHSEIAEQHANSAHAQIAEHGVEGGRTSCLPCHSEVFNLEMIAQPRSDGASAEQMSAAIAQLTPQELQEFEHWTQTTANCTNCHNPHGEAGHTTAGGESALLRRALAVIDPSQAPTEGAGYLSGEGAATFDHLCAQCHIAGTSSTPDPTDAALRRGTARSSAHSNAQYYMLVGRGGVERGAADGDQPGDDGDDDTTADFATHTTVADQCSGCHMPSGSHALTIDYAASCSPCHTATAAQALAQNQSAEVQARLEELIGRLNAWALETYGGETSWEFTSYIAAGDPTPDQATVPIEVLRARHNIHLIESDASHGIHNPTYTDELLDAIEANLNAAGIPAAAATRAGTLGDVRARRQAASITEA